MSKTMSRDALAAEYKLDPRTVSAILARAGIERQGRGFPADAARSAIVLDVDPALIVGHAASGRGSVELPAVKALAEARAESEAQRSRKLRISNDQAEGRLVRRDEVSATLDDIAATLKQTTLSVASRIAPRLVGLNDARQVRTLLHTELQLALNEAEDSLRAAGKAFGVAA